MLSFAWPWMGLLLIVPVSMWLLNHSRTYTSTDTRERKVTLLHPDLNNLQAAFSTHRPATTIGTRVYYLLLALAVARPDCFADAAAVAGTIHRGAQRRL